MTIRYTVLIERTHEQEKDYTDGSDASAVQQLAKELQAGWDEAGIAGDFQIIRREVVTADQDEGMEL